MSVEYLTISSSSIMPWGLVHISSLALFLLYYIFIFCLTNLESSLMDNIWFIFFSFLENWNLWLIVILSKHHFLVITILWDLNNSKVIHPVCSLFGYLMSFLLMILSSVFSQPFTPWTLVLIIANTCNHSKISLASIAVSCDHHLLFPQMLLWRTLLNGLWWH